MNKTKDLLWSLNAAQRIGNILFKMELLKKNQQFQAKPLSIISWLNNKSLNLPTVMPKKNVTSTIL